MSIDRKERYSRQADLVPDGRLQLVEATVIGTGAIGRQVALQLAAIGVPKIKLVDFDKVEDGNLAAQGFMEEDLGKLKINAVAELCRKINSEIEVKEEDGRFRRSMDVGNVVFCCVDSIETRKFIWEAIYNRVQLFVDGRMSAEVLRILAVDGPESAKYYPDTLFSAEEAYRGSCTAKSTIYTSNVAAGMMVGTLAKKLRNLPIDHDVQLNIMTNELDAKEVA